MDARMARRVGPKVDIDRDIDRRRAHSPPGFLHGFLGLDNENIVIYNCTNYRDKNSQLSIKWNDNDLNINWPIKKPILSNNDKNNITFKNYLGLK